MHMLDNSGNGSSPEGYGVEEGDKVTSLETLRIVAKLDQWNQMASISLSVDHTWADQELCVIGLAYNADTHS